MNSGIAIRRKNKIAVFRQLLSVPETTKPELAASLGLSQPTVGMIIDELMQAGMVRENGMASSIGGRRAVSLQAVRDCRLTLGIDITANHISFAVVNLAGFVVANQRRRAAYASTADYHRLLEQYLDEFLAEKGIPEEKLMAAGVSVPGIIGPDRRTLIRSHILRNPDARPLPDEFRGKPIRFFNDAESACMAECYSDESPDSFVFLMLSNSVGGATVINQKILNGLHNRNGEFGGRRCYCGQQGHYDAYGAAWLLAEKTGGNLAEFFKGLERGDAGLTAVLEEYLDYLSLLIANLILGLDLPVIIGGYVGNYLEPYLPKLRRKVAKQDIFGEQDPDIRTCRAGEEAAAAGCAMYFSEQFIESL